ncbi:MAG: hypothetical protein K6G10_13585 [Butyrivibrio sp.]|nr:hypothetical protein [Butyrivibrio sp.]
MDKVEYKIRADEIKALIGEGRFAEAVRIADTIDWKRVKSVSMLCTISDLYKINRRYEESRDVLLMAYDRHPTGRAIVYSLCELAIKMGEFVQAVEYYKEFVRIAPRDTGRYILQYKIYEAQEVSLEERIAVLEEFKKHDYRERWAYELAYLYHRVGLTTECIEECDEMFLWFGEGRYVMKALELKALHEPLSPEQQDRYMRYKQNHGGMVDASIVSEKDEVGKDETRTIEIKQPTKEMPPITDEVIAAYNNGELQPEAEEDFGETREFVPGEEGFGPIVEEEPADDTGFIEGGDTTVFAPVADTTPVTDTAPVAEEPAPVEQPDRDLDEIVYPHITEIKEPSVDVSAFNTMNLQETIAESLRQVIGDDYKPMEGEEEAAEEQQPELQQGVQPITEEIFEDDEDLPEEAPAPEGMQEVFFNTSPKMGIEIKYGGNGPILGEAKFDTENEPEKELETENETEPVEEAVQAPVTQVITPQAIPLEDEVPGAVIHPNANYKMHNHFESMLSQEYDGQISMAVEPEPMVEKQITGQISIDEYMQNWEDFKKTQQEKQLERVKKLVAQETGDMFADFDEKTKAGLQEKIEKAIEDAMKQERHDKASGRGDWSRTNEDVINEAVAGVVGEEAPEYDDPDALLPEEDEEPETEAAPAEEAATDVVSEEILPEEEETSEAEETAEEASADEEAAEKPENAAPEEGTAEKSAEEENAAEESDDEESSEDETDSEDAEETKKSGEAKEESGAEEPEKAPDSADAKAARKKHGGKKHIGNRELEERVRTMTPEEKELFGPYIHHKKSRRQIINAIDNLSMDAFSGNAIVTGEEGAGTVNLAKGLIKAMQASDSNFSGKVAKITANTLNKKSTASIFDKLANGALIIQRAADLESETVSELLKILQQENKGLVIVMEDNKEDMDRFLDKNPSLKQSFNVRVDIEALDDDSLVAYARQYALEKEYTIDNLGILALHTRISERQTLDHDVTVSEVKDIVDDAIYYAEKKSVGHLMDVIVNKRFDENDMVILREKDFMH